MWCIAEPEIDTALVSSNVAAVVNCWVVGVWYFMVPVWVAGTPSPAPVSGGPGRAGRRR